MNESKPVEKKMDVFSKLSEASLIKKPEEVFDILEKLGEGAYGSVYKALYKEAAEIVAIKQVPVESDLQEILKVENKIFFAVSKFAWVF